MDWIDVTPLVPSDREFKKDILFRRRFAFLPVIKQPNHVMVGMTSRQLLLECTQLLCEIVMQDVPDSKLT